MTELEKYIHTYFGVGQEEVAKISGYFQPVRLKKGDYYLRTGRRSDRLAFVQSGIVREYVVLDDREITKWISTQGYFLVDLASFFFHQPARWNLQALTDCELFVIDQAKYQQIGREVARWPQLEKLFIARCFTVLEDRIVMHLSMNAEERYRYLLGFNKELFNQVPLQYLASLLGMTPETLSRLRKKVLD
ncbi:Crp/Fnr family transcriptional regulator [Rhabdobacter roseus]|uniref:CRP-like cAMP-binding protein n=1 Tax=Rhabdobacter roseus TaxID=1655419 RepID=A0A840TXB9_9BACT|nr:Crp/Fnr family transcriptional regulator [Rhabdobacter roseus]MBB5286227.1 CRP-like cAMP-binding protein [Rhabdobacter roseus]